jgi:hypothetical protein
MERMAYPLPDKPSIGILPFSDPDYQFRPHLYSEWSDRERHCNAWQSTGVVRLVPQNFILTADGLKLIDFDYAGYGWVAAELASAVPQFEMTDVETEHFLKLYDPAVEDAQRARLR